jgi:hypothetical protein
MIHITEEGGTLKNGFNFYPLRDTSSFGFRFRYGPKMHMNNLRSKLFIFRYSKQTKRWIIGSRDSSITGNLF